MQVTSEMIESFVAKSLPQKALIDAIDVPKMTPVELIQLTNKIIPYLNKAMGFTEFFQET